VWTHSGLAASVGAPGTENSAQLAEQTFEVGGLLLQELPDMDARGGTAPPQRRNALDVSERHAESPRAPDEREQTQDVCRIVAGHT
jgi:hypothetical protein